MHRHTMKALQQTSLLDGGNGAYLESQYESFLQDPDSVSPRWRAYFSALPLVDGHESADMFHSELRREFTRLTGRLRGQRLARLTGARLTQERKQVRVLQLINAYRFRGHQHARTDPLRHRKPDPVQELELSYHGLGEQDFDTVFQTGSLVGPEEATLAEILYALNRTYCGTVGAEYMHITETAEKRWIQQRLESVQSHPHLPCEMQTWLLERLTAAEGIERYLHSKYVGQKRFSLEGAESLIPLLGEVINHGGAAGIR
ncbi:MAG TPA: 2-oxoglutarate dehydrogenase E1 component, partial [Gammaproteobacteria bacterium]|nr:2-oxoglutarate dehydrogenase E1 component [Gammaproteobacteria bacterium]